MIAAALLLAGFVPFATATPRPTPPYLTPTPRFGTPTPTRPATASPTPTLPPATPTATAAPGPTATPTPGPLPPFAWGLAMEDPVSAWVEGSDGIVYWRGTSKRVVMAIWRSDGTSSCYHLRNESRIRREPVR